MTINGLVRWTIAHRLAGLEAWAGTPGTVGGAIYGNAHSSGREHRGAGRRSAVAHDRRGRSSPCHRSEMEFAYDTSRL